MEKNKLIEFQLEKFNVPERYKDMNWAKLTNLTKEDTAFANKYMKEFPDNEKESIYLFQNISGTGKTSFAICMVRNMIKMGKFKSGVPLFVSFRVLMETMRQDKDDSFLNNKLFNRILSSPFTIFDDIGTERVSESIVDRYLLLIEQLWLKKKPAIFTSKLKLSKFLERGEGKAEIEIIESIGSRLVGMCEEYELTNKEDYRNV